MPLWAASMHVCVPCAFGGTLRRQKDDQEAKTTRLQDSDCQSQGMCCAFVNIEFNVQNILQLELIEKEGKK